MNELSAVDETSICEVHTFTNRFENLGAVLSNLMVTNVLPSTDYVYITNSTTLRLPDGSTLTGAAAEPTINATELSWDLSTSIATPSVTNLLLSEVYYHTANPDEVAEKAYQWFEIFNPATNAVTLTSWYIKDTAPGVRDDLPGITIGGGEFVVVAGTTIGFMSDNPGYTGQVFQVADGEIGSGLNHFGDGVQLFDADDNRIDAMSYGASRVGLNPACPLVATSHSLARDPANEDTDSSANWMDQAVPDPGAGNVVLGMNLGDYVEITYDIKSPCAANSGQFESYTYYEQPPGSSTYTNRVAHFLTINEGDLTVTKTPVSQNAIVGDSVEWTVTIENVGFGNAENVVIYDEIGPGISFTNLIPAPVSQTVSNAAWDDTVIPALTNLAPGESVTVTVQGEVLACSNLYNRADAQWGCDDGTVCEDTRLNGQTASAGIRIMVLLPKVSSALSVDSIIPIDYCGGTPLTVYLTNAPGAAVAQGLSVSNIFPSGWSMSGTLVTNNVVTIGDLPGGASTSFEVTIEPGGNCPYSTVPQPIYFMNDYTDVCGRSYKPPVLAAMVQITNEPMAAITKSIPSFSGDDSTVPVLISLTYENFSGSEQIDFVDIYPSSTNLTVANIGGGGTQGSGEISWSVTGLSGSGVYTTGFDLVVGATCGGPEGVFFNELVASNYVDCRGCTRDVFGDQQLYPVRVSRGTGCPGTGGCDFVSTKVADGTISEVCQPMTLTHTYTNFGGTLPDWTGVTFVSDLADENGYLWSDTNYTVHIDGSNVTAYTVLSITNPTMEIDLSGLNASAFPTMGSVTETIVFSWDVIVTNRGQAVDRSALVGVSCGSGSDVAVWNVGSSEMEISLTPFLMAEECGIVTGRVDIAQIASPELEVGSNDVFATYDVEIVIDLDADTNGLSAYDYVNDSFIFTNMIDIGGTPITGGNPVIADRTLTWFIGDLQANGAGTILFDLRAGCTDDTNGQSSAYVDYNDACDAGGSPTAFRSYSETNDAPLLFEPILDNFIAQHLSFLSDTQYVVELTFLNSGAGAAYNVLPELDFPTNIVYGSATLAPSTISDTNIVWNLHNVTSPLGDLEDLDNDGYRNDLPPLGMFTIIVTNQVKACDEKEVYLRTVYGCKGQYCGIAYDYAGMYEVSQGSLVSRFVLPNDAELCATNTVEISVKNSGLTTDYDIQVSATLPTGVTLIPSSTRYSYNEGTTNSTTDPVVGGITNTWSSTQIPEFAAMDPTNVVKLLFDVYVDCDAASYALLFTADSSFIDNCGVAQQEDTVTSQMQIKEPDISVEKTAMIVGGSEFSSDMLIVEPPEDVLYRIRVTNTVSVTSADAKAVELADYLPTNVLYKGASITPDYVSGATNGAVLAWSNSTIMTELGSSVFAQGTAFDIVITGEVTGCSVDLVNQATLAYGCDESTLCQSASDTHSLRTQPVNSIGTAEALNLTTCGGTKTMVVSNSGARAENIFLVQTAPTGYVYTAASLSGEFYGTNLVVDLGNPTGRVVQLDLSDLASGARDKDDPSGVTNALHLNNQETFTVTFELASDGSNLDYLADPTDNNFNDPDYGNPAQVSSVSTTTYDNVCGGGYTNTGTSTAVPTMPNPNIDLQPNNAVVSNGQEVVFTATVINQSENGNAGNLYIRLHFGDAWTNLSITASNMVTAGVTNMLYDVQNSSNVIVDLPGVILRPYQDSIELTMKATAVEGPGDLFILAEVVGDCGNTNVVPTQAFTNIWGEAPLANTMTSSVPGISAPVDGAYYSFDQDSTVVVGYEIKKNVRYDDEAAIDGSDSRTARIGESLIYRLESHFFGTVFSNATVIESLPANLEFPTSDQFSPSYSGGATNATYTNGIFSLQSNPLSNHPSVFIVDIPVVVSNSAANNNGVNFTNAATSTFDVPRFTNEIPVYSTTITIREPNVGITKTSDKQDVEDGDLVTFSVTVTNTGPTNAYDLVIYDTLPAGMIFHSAVSPATVVSVDPTHFNISTNQDGALSKLIDGGTYTWSYRAIVTNQLVGTTLTNDASVTYLSLDPASSNSQIRTGTGSPSVNDYTNETTVTVTVENMRAIDKAVVSTSQTNTLDVGTTNNLTIGERIVYDIRVDMPQGIVSNMAIVDLVPLGLDWVGVNDSSDLTYAPLGYAFTVPAGGPAFPQTVGAGLVITDADPTPASSLTSDGSGVDITFTIPAVTNTYDGNAGNDYFILSMEFVVLDDPINDGIGATYRIATNGVTVSDDFTTLTNYAPPYSVVEPNLNITKTITPTTVDASNTLAVSVVVLNQTSARSEAYKMDLADLLEDAEYDSSTLAMVEVPMGWGVSNLAVAGGLTHYLYSSNEIGLAPGESITNRFTIDVAQGVAPNEIYTNNVALFYSSTLYDKAPTNIRERVGTDTASDTFNIPGITMTKVMFATSETNTPPDSTNTFVQIGEIITYELNVTLPESTITNLAVFDSIPDGLSYIYGSATTDVSSFNGTLPVLSEVPSGPGALADDGADVTFTFNGDTIVLGDGVPGNNTFSIYLDAVVLDTNSNVGLLPNPTILTNIASVTYAGNPSSAVWSVEVTNVVVEPQIEIFKSMAPTNIQAGDVISVEFAITNAGVATLYEVELADDLATIFQSGTVTNAVIPTGYVMNVSSDILYFRSDTNTATGTNTLEAGEGLTFTFDVAARTDLQPNVALTNYAAITGDSLASTNVYDIEREYAHTNEAALRLVDFQMQKVLYATSETGPADSTNANVQIGEVVTYELSAVIPAGASTNLQFVDYLPDGMAYVVDSLIVIPGSTNIQLSSATNVTPSVGLMGNDGQDVTITFTGVTLVNNVADPALRTLDLRIQSVVLDTNSNVGVAPQMVLTNIASVTYDGNPSPPAFSTMVTNPVIEPTILIDKAFDITGGDAGDPVICTLTVTNTGLASAYDLQFDDLVMGGFFDITTISNVSMPDGFTYALNTALPNATVTYASDPASTQPTNCIEAAEGLTFRFGMHLAQSVEPGQLLTNGCVVAAADTIDGTNVYDEARDESGARSSDDIIVSNMMVEKTFVTTSETGPSDTTGTNVTIGETATYRLTATLPESTITNLAVADIIPTGMSYVNGSVSVDTTGFNGTLPGAPTVTTVGGSGDDVTFTFNGHTVVNEDNVGANNSFTIDLQLLTRDEVGNVGLSGTQTILSNVATIAYDSNPPMDTSTVVNVIVEEPRLEIDKTMIGPSNDVVFVRFAVTNSGLSSAYDMIVTDVFSTNWWDTTTITAASIPEGFTYAITNAPGDGYVAVMVDTNSLQPTNAVEVGEVVTFEFAAQLIPDLVGTVTNTAVIAQYTTIDGTNPDERFEPLTNDTETLVLPGVAITKTRTSPFGRAAAVGETVVFSIMVTNTGDLDLDPVDVLDTFDSTYLSYVSAVPTPDSTGAGAISWTNVGPLAAGGTTSLVVNFTAIASTDPTDTTNRAVVSAFTTNGLPLPPRTNTAPVEVKTVGYTLEKTVSSPAGRSAQVGETIEFDVLITNTGETQLVTVPVLDTFDNSYITFLSADPAPDSTTANSLTWNDVGPLAANGQSTNLVVRFTAIQSSASENRTNAISTAPTTPPNDPPVGPKTNTAPYSISEAGYSLVKTRVSPVGRSAYVGEEVVFSIAVENTGDVALVTVPMVDTYETTYLSYIASTPVSDDNVDDGVINWADLTASFSTNLMPGESFVVTSRYTAVGTSMGLDRTNVVVTTPTTPPDEPDVPPLTNDAPYSISSPGYTLVKDVVSPVGRAAQVGESVVFAYTIVNTGDVELVTLPAVDTYETAYLTYVDSSPASDDNVSDGIINWTDLTLSFSTNLLPGDTFVITSRFTAAATSLSLDRTNVVVTTPTTPPDEPGVSPRTNAAPYSISSAGYSLVKTTLSPVGRSAAIGEPIVFTLTVANTGDVQLITVPVLDTYETSYLSYVSSVPASDDNVNDGSINWADIGPVAVGASTTIVVNCTAVGSSMAEDRTNTVSTAPTTPPAEPNVPPSTNVSPYSISSPGYTLVKDVISPVGRSAQVGESVVFTYTLVNTGDVELVTLPAVDTYETTYLTYVNSTPASDDNISDGTIHWADLTISFSTNLLPGDTFVITSRFTAATTSLSQDRTNVVVTTPATPPDQPGVPPSTNDAPYSISSAGYSLAKTTVSPSGRSAAVGEAIVFHLTVSNTGDVQLVTVPVLDSYETNYLTYMSSVPASEDNVNDGVINWTDIGPVAVGASTTIVVNCVAAGSSVAEDRTNTVSTAPTTPPDEPNVPPATNISPYSISSPGYTLVKDVLSPVGRSAQVGESVVFTYTIVNTGDVELVTLPAVDSYETTYLTYVDSTPASDDNISDGTINWADLTVSFSTNLLPGETFVITSRFTAVTSSLSLDRTNTVETTPTTPPDQPGVPPLTNEAPYRISSPGYTLVKDVISPVGRSAQVGESVVFTYTIVNTGDVELVTLPAVDTYETTYLTYNDSTPASDDNISDGTINWSDLTVSFSTNLLPGDTFVITSRFTAAATSLSLDRTNVVVTAPTTPPDEPSVPPRTNDAPYSISRAGYSLVKTTVSPSGRSAAVGETIVFNLTVSNTGDVQLVTVPIRDTYETNYLTYVSAVPASDDNLNDGMINWADVGPLAVGASTTIVVNCTAASSSVAENRTNTVSTVPTTPPDEPSVPPATNSSPYSISSPGYTLVKDVVSPVGRAAQVGESVLFKYTIVNTGDVELVTLPAVDSYETNYLTYVDSVPASDDNVSDGTIDWTDLTISFSTNLLPGDTFVVTSRFTAVASSMSLDRTNVVATAPTTPPDQPGVPPLTNDAPYRISSPGYTLVKDVVSPVGRSAQVGESVVFTYTLVNTGDVELVTLPAVDTYETAYLTYVESMPASDDNVSDGTIHWADLTVSFSTNLLPGDTFVITSRFTAAATSLSLDRTNVVVTTPTTPPDEPGVPPLTNDAPYSISSAGYSLTKTTVSPSGRSAEVGEAVVFNLTIVNTGDVQLVTVPVTDTYETTYLTYVDSMPASDDNVNDGVINWADIGPVASGASTTIVVNCTAASSSVAEDRTNTVSTAPTTPPDEPLVPPATNTSPYSISSPGYTLVKDVISPVGRSAQVGETVLFTYTLVNTGDVELVTLPAVDSYETTYLTYVDSVPASDDNVSDGTINWSDLTVSFSTNLLPGDTFVVTSRFTAAASSLSLDRTNVVVTTPTTPVDKPGVPERTNDAPYRISGAAYQIVKNVVSPVGRSAAIGEQIQFEIEIVNTGDVELVTVPLTDVYETSYLTYLSSAPASDDNINDGQINWTDLTVSFGTNLMPGNRFVITSRYTAVATSVALNRTNVVWTAPTTPPTEPSVEPKTNDAPYQISDPKYLMTKELTSPLGRDADLGETIVFEIAITNHGDVQLVTVPVVDTYDTATLSYTSSQPIVDLAVPGTLTWSNVGPMSAGAATTLVVRFTALAVTPLETNVVVTTPTVPPGMPSVPPQTNDAPYAIDQSDYLMTKTRLSPSPVYVDQGVAFRIDIMNTGIVDMVELPVQDVFDTTYLSYTSAIPPADVVGVGSLQWTNIGYLSGGAATSITVQFTAVSPTTGNETNTAIAWPVAPSNEPPFDVRTNSAPYDIDPRCALGDFVWYDLNADGIQDDGEMGVAAVPVALYDGSSTFVTNMITSLTGHYLFTDLLPGDYYVVVSKQTNYFFSPQGQGTDPAKDSDVNPASGVSTTVTLVAGETNLNVDAGMYQLGSLAGTVYNDVDDNGKQEVDEQSFPNVTMHLYDAATSNRVATTITDGQGDYLFNGLVPKKYFVGVEDSTLPSGFSIGRHFTNPSAKHMVNAGQHVPDVDFAYLNNSKTTAIVGDYVWSDYNNNGLQEPGEPGIGNVKLSLITAGPDGFFGTKDDVTHAVTKTDSAGLYLFTNVAPNEYIVKVHDGAGTPVAGLDSVSGDQSFSGQTSPFTMVAGGAYLEADFGFYGIKGTLGNLVFMDLDANGAYDGDDYGMGNVTVNLMDAHGSVLASTTTDGTGYYQFVGLAAGDYVVEVSDVHGVLNGLDHTIGTPDANNQSQVNPYSVTLSTGGSIQYADFGYAAPPGSLGNLVFIDVNRDGLFSADDGDIGLKDITVNRYDENTNLVATTVTDVNGQYLFTDLDAGTYLIAVDAGTVNTNLALGPIGPNPGVNNNSQVQPYIIVLTNQGRNLTADFGYITDGTLRYGGAIYYDCNGDQKKDPWELGVPNIEVTLYMDLNTNGVVDDSDFAIAKQDTDSNGDYLFDHLPAGYYVVIFDDPYGLLSGTEPTFSKTSLRAASIVTTLHLTQDTIEQNLGYRKKQATGSIGKTCWVDVNRNGLPDEDLSIYGLNNVILNLYTVKAGVTNFYEQQITQTGPDSQRGYFDFTSVPYGQYLVEVDMDSIPSTLNYPTTPTSFSPILCSNNVFGAIGFGYASDDPTAVEMKSFTGSYVSGKVKLAWETGVEQDNLGFYIYRATSLSGARTRMNQEIIDGAADGVGKAYLYIDAAVEVGRRYYYWLEDVDTSYVISTNGPVSVLVPQDAAQIDFDNDRMADLVVYDAATGTWSIRTMNGVTRSVMFGWNEADAVPGDYDGDGRTDLAVFWPAAGEWIINSSLAGTTASHKWGWAETVPVQADYDGDGKTDLAIYWSAMGYWHILQSSDEEHVLGQWGWSAAQPVPADYDGDGKDDMAVYWPAGGWWIVNMSASGERAEWKWGWNATEPVSADYDGDGVAEIAVYNAEGGWWIIYNSVSGESTAINWGWTDALPVPDDYDGDGKADIAVYWPEGGLWIVRRSSDLSALTIEWGGGGDVPVR